MNTAEADITYMKLVQEFPLVPLRKKTQFNKAIAMMKRLAYKGNLTQGEADYLAVLDELIIQYEDRLPRLTPEISPREALLYLMDVNGLTQKDLVEYVGHKSNLSAFLNGHRGLSKRAACRLAERFAVSPSLFLPKE